MLREASFRNCIIVSITFFSLFLYSAFEFALGIALNILFAYITINEIGIKVPITTSLPNRWRPIGKRNVYRSSWITFLALFDKRYISN